MNLDIKLMTHACLEAVLFAERDMNQAEDDDTSLDSAGYSVTDFTPEAWDAARAEVVPFVWANRRLLRAAIRYFGYTDEQAGHDIYFTSAGHGAGFWDRGLGDIGRALSDAVGRREWNVWSDDAGRLSFN